MSYKKRKPVPEKDMFKSRYKGHHTICETLREIYQLSNDENIKLKCRLSMSMAKSMHERLKKYNKETDERNKRVEEKRKES